MSYRLEFMSTNIYLHISITIPPDPYIYTHNHLGVPAYLIAYNLELFKYALS